MRAVAKINDRLIDDMQLDITFQMKVSEWRMITKQGSEWPLAHMRRHILAVLGHVTKATNATFTDPLSEADVNQ